MYIYIPVTSNQLSKHIQKKIT